MTTTLFKVVSNILTSPFEPKYRKLPRNSNSVQEKILAFPNACNFLKVAGFKFDEPGEHISMAAYSKEELEECLLALKIFVEKLGGAVKDPLGFNPFQASVSSTTGQAAVPKNATSSGGNKISNTQSQIKNILKQREDELETFVEDREIQIYNQKASVQTASMNTNQFLARLEQRQAEDAARKAGRAAATEENKGAATDSSAAAGTTMINTMGGGVKIGSNNPQIQEIVAAEVTDRDEQVAALQFLGE